MSYGTINDVEALDNPGLSPDADMPGWTDILDMSDEALLERVCEEAAGLIERAATLLAVKSGEDCVTGKEQYLRDALVCSISEIHCVLGILYSRPAESGSPFLNARWAVEELESEMRKRWICSWQRMAGDGRIRPAGCDGGGFSQISERGLLERLIRKSGRLARSAARYLALRRGEDAVPVTERQALSGVVNSIADFNVCVRELNERFRYFVCIEGMAAAARMSWSRRLSARESAGTGA